MRKVNEARLGLARPGPVCKLNFIFKKKEKKKKEKGKKEQIQSLVKKRCSRIRSLAIFGLQINKIYIFYFKNIILEDIPEIKVGKYRHNNNNIIIIRGYKIFHCLFDLFLHYLLVNAYLIQENF